MKKQLFVHKRFVPAIFSALIAVSFSASTALASPADCPMMPNDECRYMMNDDRAHHSGMRFHCQQIVRGHSAEYLAKTYSLDQDLVQSYIDDGWHFRDLSHGALIAKASGNSLETVLKAKEEKSSWRSVAASFHLTQAQLQDTRFDIRASRMAERLDMNKYTLKALLKDGYHPRDIMMANFISKKSDKPILKVLSMKKINNTWQDVAEEVGLSPREMRDRVPHHGFGHQPRGHHHR